MSSASIVVTPGQLARRAELYHQFAQLTVAGLGLQQSIEQLRRHPPHSSYREPLERTHKEIARGFTFTESLRRSGNWLPDFDLSLIEAGELSGRLDACFRKLGDYYQERAAMARQLIGDMAYPVFLIHFAVFIIPFAQLFISGDFLSYAFKTFGILIPLYIIVAVVIYAAQSKHGESWRAVFETILNPIPILGSARRDLALARLAMSLEALISAGVAVVQAWELAGPVSGSPRLRRAVNAWKRNVESGQTVAEAMSASGQFPDMFANQYASAEISGKLDEVLGRMHHYYQDSGQRKMRALAQWTPRIIYLIVALLIAIHIVRFYAGYFNQIGNVLNGF